MWYHKQSASSCKSRRHIPDADLIYRPDFLLENITQLTAHWWTIKNILNKIFNSTLFEIMFLCVRIKYFSLNIDILDWIQIYFVECKYFYLNIKYFSLSINIFLLNPNIFYWIQIYFLKCQIFLIEYKYFVLNTNIFCWMQISNWMQIECKYQIFFIEYKYLLLNTNIFYWI